MSRSGTPSTFSNESVQFFTAIDFELDDEIVGFWSGYGDLTFGSRTYTGAADLMSISPISEELEVSAQGITVVFAGLDTVDDISLQDDYQFRKCNLYVGSLNNYPAEVQSYKIFSGLIDTIRLADDGETSTVTVTIENRLIDLERPRVQYYTDQEQKDLYPGGLVDDDHPSGLSSLVPDSCLSDLADLQEAEIKWGTA